MALIAHLRWSFPLLGFSINTLSLLGLVLAIGIVVDDAIVVVESVSEKMEQGLGIDRAPGDHRHHERGVREPYCCHLAFR